MKFTIFFGLVSAWVFCDCAHGQGCNITIPLDIPKSEPVILVSSDTNSPYNLFTPTGNITTIPLNSRILLSCPGTGNLINALSQAFIELICTLDNKLTDVNTTLTYVLKDLGCKAIPTAVLRKTSQRCANDNGYIFEVGFDYAINQFAKLFTICYDNVTETTFYTHNTLNGAAIKYSIQESTRRAFRADGMSSTTTAINTFYTIANEISRFESYFGTQQTYVNNSMYLARGHLTPDADFVFSYEQLATYFYTNVGPEFQIINAGNWLRVENLARSLSMNYQSDLEIYNGYMGVLQIINTSTNQITSIYLDAGQKIEVPKYFFKVIKQQSTDSAIVMITVNNPYASDNDVIEFCPNVCAQANVQNAVFSDLNRGYTFCCELNTFQQFYSGLPADLSATKLLRATSNGNDTEPIIDDITEAPVTGCTIKMPTDIPNPEPVYSIVTPKNSVPQLLKPTGEYTILPFGSNLTLSCIGSGNQFNALQQQTLTLTCRDDFTFYSIEKSQVFTLSQLNCTNIPTSDLLKTSNPCSKNAGYFFEAGFKLNTGFLSAFSICYDNTTEQTLYSRNIINGATQNYKINESTRRAFRADGMRFTTTATNTFYTIANEISRFETYFGTQQTYVNNSMYLARGHLTPDADFVFGYEQLATYFYANVAPEFQIINAGNWLRVENIARALALEFGSDLLTFTSTMSILNLPNSSYQLQPIYLDDGQYIEAPQWYYKVLIHPELPANLVMMTLNNPFANIANINEFCTNVCDVYRINSPYFKDVSRGYTFCCTYDNFKQSLPNLPTFDTIDNWVIL